MKRVDSGASLRLSSSLKTVSYGTKQGALTIPSLSWPKPPNPQGSWLCIDVVSIVKSLKGPVDHVAKHCRLGILFFVDACGKQTTRAVIQDY